MTADLGTIFYYPRHRGPRDLVRISAELAGGPFDHLFLTETYSEIFSTAAALTSVVGPEITLGTAVSNVYFHHPYEMAMAVANVADLTGGRFVLGLGTGHQEVNVAGLGLDMDRPLTYLRRYVEVLRACLTSGGAPIQVRNPSFQVTGLPLPWGHREAADVPLILGALGDPMCKLAGSAADGVVLSHASASRASDVAALLAANRPADAPRAKVYAIVNVIVDESRDRARDIIRPFVSRYTRFPFYRALYQASGVEILPDGSISDAGIDQVAIAGPRSYVRERVAAFREAGVDVPILSPASVLDPQGDGDPARAYAEFAADVAG
ncbi:MULTISPECIES: LLM class flavin-dependent oxidoreductase [unclassified Solwaraspora]|uniref:LLM class flavin-dependent oxidoreductase n=1 Tax=unclassified Solwaraspora TaxID=2627926 RepID=UPI00259BDD23|nr:LLM class flavin-dependent oxidoreductase [Solwaraspora sp. WMMA2056]WJK43034.1 LLM class flavin-dependent oxidoreductase [Solwaraspora sp. WMMA2056]